MRPSSAADLLVSGRDVGTGQGLLGEDAQVERPTSIYDALGLPVDSDAHRRVLAVLRYLNGS